MPRGGSKTSGTFTKTNRPRRTRKGVPNKCTASVRAILQKAVLGDEQAIELDLKKLKKVSLYKFWQVKIKLMRFFMPELAAIHVSGADAGVQPLKPPIILMGNYTAEERIAAENAVETNISFANGGPGHPTPQVEEDDFDEPPAPRALTHDEPPQLPSPIIAADPITPAAAPRTNEPMVVGGRFAGDTAPRPGGIDLQALAAAERERKQSLRLAMAARIEEDNERERMALAERERKQRALEEQ